MGILPFNSLRSWLGSYTNYALQGRCVQSDCNANDNFHSRKQISQQLLETDIEV